MRLGLPEDFRTIASIWDSRTYPGAEPPALIERAAMTMLAFVYAFSPVHLKRLFASEKKWQRIFIESYVVVWIVGLVLILVLDWGTGRLFACILGYELLQISVYRLYFIFVKSRWRPWGKDLRRSLLMSMLNAVQLVLGFAVLYRDQAWIAAECGHGSARSSVDAVYFSLVTITTVGFGDLHPCDSRSRLLVAAEVLSGAIFVLFLFPAIVSLVSADLKDCSGGNSQAQP